MRRYHNLLPLLALLISTTSCEDIDNHRLPPVAVNIVFSTLGDWTTYGVAGPGQSRQFIKAERIPAGYFYKESEFTGFGGVLLLCDPNGSYTAFDLACPVECRANIRVEWETGTQQAGIMRCPECGSRYDVYSYGTAVSGKALEYKYGLEPYHVVVGNSAPPYAAVMR